MAYSTYTTEAIVCGSRDRNTFDRSLLLFTRAGGMLYAEARSARREESKQRYALQEFTRVRVSLVRGKSGWRIGSIEALENFYSRAKSREARGSVVRLIKLVRRLTPGEEAHIEAYDYVLEALHQLAVDVVDRRFLEALAQVHFLALLGYVAIGSLPPVLQNYTLVPHAETPAVEFITLLERHLKSSLEYSHL